MITAYLSQLQGGLQQNIGAARALLKAQEAIRDRNALLSDMAGGARRISEGLDGLLDRTEVIHTQVVQVSEANRDTLALNRDLLGVSTASERDLVRVAAALRRMNQSAAVIHQQIEALQHSAAADVNALETIGANTARMNARTPGW